jgi:phosphatidylglycerophosphatase A
MIRIEHIEGLNFKSPYAWLATWFGAGLINPAPGTWGSLVAIPFGLIIYKVTGLTGLLLATILVTFIGYWAAKRFQEETGVHDCKAVVIDEVAGQWLVLLPALFWADIELMWIAIAFVLFRIFDIVKPWPASYFDKKVDNAFGVMADDIVAGIFAALVMSGMFYAIMW